MDTALETATAKAVTKIVDRIPRSGMERDLEAAIRNLNAAATRSPGYLGMTVTPPVMPAQPGFRMVLKFDTAENLRRWEESSEKQRLAALADRYTLGEPRYEVLTGLEPWFTLSAAPSVMPPSRGRMTVATWLGIFPLVYVYSLAVNWLLPVQTLPVFRVAVVTVLVVPTMTYIVAPRLTRLLRRWLYPQK